jgi:hypothetical protein
MSDRPLSIEDWSSNCRAVPSGQRRCSEHPQPWPQVNRARSWRGRRSCPTCDAEPRAACRTVARGVKARIWNRYGSFVAQPSIHRSVVGTLADRPMTIAGERGITPFKEIVA